MARTRGPMKVMPELWHDDTPHLVVPVIGGPRQLAAELLDERKKLLLRLLIERHEVERSAGLQSRYHVFESLPGLIAEPIGKAPVELEGDIELLIERNRRAEIGATQVVRILGLVREGDVHGSSIRLSWQGFCW